MAMDAGLLRAVAPRNSGTRGVNQTAIIAVIGPVLEQILKAAEINTPRRIAHFIAQACTESDGFVTTIEYSDGAYLESRKDLGNTKPGDGPRYKGRGLIQLTGRTNYRQYGQLLRMDLEGQPDLAAEPVLSLRIACQYWTAKRLNGHADYDDIRTITQLVNGGQNGIADRKAYLAKAKAALNVANSQLPPRPALKQGDRGDQVFALQTHLRLAGRMVGLDGDFGPGTETAIKQFQSQKGLANSGIVDQKIWTLLG